jgi:uncharacterized membrane protein
MALLSISTALFIIAALFPKLQYNEQLIVVARWNLWIGAAITAITLAAGFQAYNSVAHDTASHAAMTNHRNWAIPTAIAFFILAFWQAKRHPQKRVSSIFIFFMICASLALVTTAYKGGELVYRYGLGVMSLPVKEDHGHKASSKHSHDAAKHSDQEKSESTESHGHKTMNNHNDGHDHGN